MAMSPFLADEFYKNHKIKPQFIVPNALDPEMFAPNAGVAKDIDILGAGSFEPLKQYDVFTRVVKSLADAFPALQARHCGMGRERKKIEALVSQLALQKNLQLLGERTHKEVLQLMQRAKIFLHTSSYEGFSTVCLEALNAGAHVISFCYPLHQPVRHWHVVHSEKEMLEKAAEILQNRDTEYTPVLLYRMAGSAKMVMELFHAVPDEYEAHKSGFSTHQPQKHNHH